MSEGELAVEIKLMILAQQQIKRFQVPIALGLNLRKTRPDVFALSLQTAAQLFPFLVFGDEIGRLRRPAGLILRFAARRRWRLDGGGHDDSFRQVGDAREFNMKRRSSPMPRRRL